MTRLNKPESELLQEILQTIRVEPQKFVMGSDPKSPERSNWEYDLRESHLFSPFEMGRFPVTNILWTVVTGDSIKGDPLLPKTDVSWNEALEFCFLLNKMLHLPQPFWREEGGAWKINLGISGFRFPLEGEWECACRAGTIEDRYGPLDDIAWTAENSSGVPKPVGLKMPNAWGFYDTIGNVWEWCWEEVNDTPNMNASLRVAKGGSCDSMKRYNRAGASGTLNPIRKSPNLGFRLARTIVDSAMFGFKEYDKS
jgi:formylglycine-generating enzyme required for sulfatase activity